MLAFLFPFLRYKISLTYNHIERFLFIREPMDLMKHFLDKVCHSNSDYHYEKLDNIGEIYQKGDIMPIALIDHNEGSNLYSLRFRLGLASHKIAKLTNELTIVYANLIFEDDFLIHEQYGYLYGDDARKAFIERIQSGINVPNEPTQSGVIYVSTEPVFTYGNRTFGKIKIEKLWGDNDGSF
jgi:hypothetical protein